MSCAVFTVSAVPESDLDQVFELSDIGFHERTSAEERERRRWRFLRADRIGAYDEGRLVGFVACLPMDISVPGGGTLPCTGVTFVAVLPTYRRRGVLTAMLDRVWRDGSAPLAALYVSEAAIYGRFGFGVATHATHVEVDSDLPLEFRVTPDPRPLRLLTGEDARAAATEDLGSLYEREGARRPGQFRRDAQWWAKAVLPDEDEDDEDLTAPRVVVLQDCGYAIYRTKRGDYPAGPPGTVHVVELAADTPEAQAALWRYLSTIDLTWLIKSTARPVDDLLPILVTDPDLVRITRQWDALWLRLADVRAALEGRGWAAPADVVLDIADTRIAANNGRWRLRTGLDGAVCEPTTEPADLAMDVRDLASVYLGDTAVARLVRAGVVTEHGAGAAEQLDRALRVPLAPFAADEY